MPGLTFIGLHRFVGILDSWFDNPRMPKIFQSKPKPPTNAQPPQQQDKLALKDAKWGGYRDAAVRGLASLEEDGWIVAYMDASSKMVRGWRQGGYGVWFAEASTRNYAAPIPQSERQSVSRGELRGVLHAILATGFVPAQLYTMSHHIEKAQYVAVERGPDTFTLLSYTKTYAAMEYTPPIPPGQEDRWLQTMATTLGQVVGFTTPPKHAQIKDPRAEHRAYRNWRLEAPNMALTMGVSSNRGIPQYFWLQGKEWLVRNATKHLTPKGLDVVLGAEESAQSAEPQRAQQAPQPPTERQAVRDTAPPYDEVMRRVQMQEAAQARGGGPGGPPQQMAAQPPLRDAPPPPYTPRREVYRAGERPHYEQRAPSPATSAPRQDPRTWARPSGGGRFKR